MIHIAGKTYKLVYDHKNGWNPEIFRERYSEVLERYDYIVGDWGYEKLRLKGFFRDNHPKANKDTAISGVVDYINEYCNFGCAYFVLQKVPNPSKSAGDRDLLSPDFADESAVYGMQDEDSKEESKDLVPGGESSAAVPFNPPAEPKRSGMKAEDAAPADPGAYADATVRPSPEGERGAENGSAGRADKAGNGEEARSGAGRRGEARSQGAEPLREGRSVHHRKDAAARDGRPEPKGERRERGDRPGKRPQGANRPFGRPGGKPDAARLAREQAAAGAADARAGQESRQPVGHPENRRAVHKEER
ncbi:YutD-like domain-containing protein [Paenibacillus cisolokensis]|uniref:YutD family protein n=1 Tax=Paenibacillus cisolokensis TaxID=1658519 RepID=UPI003D2E185C